MGLLQELFRTHGPAYLERFGPAMPKAHKKVIAMASGFALAAPEVASEPPAALRCRHCGGALRFSRLLLAGDSVLGGLAALGQRAGGSSTLDAVPVGP